MKIINIEKSESFTKQATDFLDNLRQIARNLPPDLIRNSEVTDFGPASLISKGRGTRNVVHKIVVGGKMYDLEVVYKYIRNPLEVEIIESITVPVQADDFTQTYFRIAHA